MEFRNWESGIGKRESGSGNWELLRIGAAFSISLEVSAITNYRFPITVTD
ncbi:MAG: hypothetical protein LH628_23360 [Microcoleus sp. CAN_BIN18]|nr:hypothetical protein [Microcoleus sp. CAN_BIN18]